MALMFLTEDANFRYTYERSTIYINIKGTKCTIAVSENTVDFFGNETDINGTLQDWDMLMKAIAFAKTQLLKHRLCTGKAGVGVEFISVEPACICENVDGKLILYIGQGHLSLEDCDRGNGHVYCYLDSLQDIIGLGASGDKIEIKTRQGNLFLKAYSNKPRRIIKVHKQLMSTALGWRMDERIIDIRVDNNNYRLKKVRE